MKKSFVLFLVLFAAGAAFLSSCKSEATAQPKSTATIIFNDTTTVIADSIHWNYYSAGVPRVQAFKNNIAIITIWPGTVATGTISLSSQYLYWIITSPAVYTVNQSGGTLTFNNSDNVLSGSLSATGNIWTGTGPAPTTVSATFSNVRQIGL